MKGYGKIEHARECDGVVIVDAPDDTAATAPGHLQATRTTRLFTVEEAMEAKAEAPAAVVGLAGQVCQARGRGRRGGNRHARRRDRRHVAARSLPGSDSPAQVRRPVS